MNSPGVVNGDDEQFVLLLAHYRDALNAGRNADPATNPTLSHEMRQRLQRALRCLHLLRKFQSQPTLPEPITRIKDGECPLYTENLVGGRLGRFLILRTLGHGGGGIVFLAFDPDLHREVALKVPHLPALLAPDMRRRFLREARAAARMDHPNLVPVHEVGETNGVCFIVSAYCRGGNLAQWLAARTTPVPFRQAAELVAMLADAVQYVHDHGTYHRDIKPGNILLDTAGAARKLDLGFTPRLTDFGLAKQMDGDSGQTLQGSIVGTPSYMAPEQFEGSGVTVGSRTDVYGLGVVLYELLTGRPPFKGATDTETLDQVMFKTPIRPRKLRAGMPSDLETICLKCLEKLPPHRYACPAELAGDLRRFLAHEPIKARPPRSTYKLGKWVRRQPWVTALVSVACFAVPALLAGGFWVHGMKREHNENLVIATKRHEEQGETLRQKEQRLRQYHYADEIALAVRHWTKRRLDELTDQLQTYRDSLDAVGSDDPRGFEWYYLSAQARLLRWRMRSPHAFLLCVAFSPDGSTCATGHEDGSIRLWDRTNGRLLRTLPGHELPVYALAYSRDGNYLVSGGGKLANQSNQGELLVWDTATLKPRSVLAERLGVINRLALSPDGRLLATAHAGYKVKLWAMPVGSLRQTFSFDEEVASVAFRSDGARLAVGHSHGRISLVDAVDGHELGRWKSHQDAVLSVTYAKTDGLLVSSGADHAVRLWGGDDSHPLGEYCHDGEVREVAISPDDRLVVSLSRDGIVKIWDVKGRCERFWFAMPPGYGRCVAFSPDGKDLAVGSQDGRLWFCDTSRAEGAPSWLGHRVGSSPREAWAVAFSPNGKTLASAGDDHLIHLWNPDDGRLVRSLSGHRSLVACIAFSPDGKLLASGSFDTQGNVKLWDATTGSEVATLSGHTQPILALGFAPDGKLLATAGRDRITRLWDVAAGTNLPILSGYNIESLAFSPDGRTLALAGDAQALFLWDIQERKLRKILAHHPIGHVSVAFSPDGQTLATGDKEGVVRFFDAATGQLRHSRHSHTQSVNCLAFSPDGKTLASAGFDKKVKLFQAATGRELMTLPEQKDRLRWLAFSADSAMLATAGQDGILTLFRADRTGRY